MNQFFILLFLLAVELNAFADNFKIKVKSVPDGNIVKMKVQIKSDMIDNDTALRKKIKSEYISHITVRVNNKTIYSVATSAYLNRSPLLKFQYNSKLKNDVFEFIVSDNNGNKVRQFFQRNPSLNRTIPISKLEKISNSTNENQISTKLWSATTTKDAINELYGSITPLNGHIKLTVPYVVANYQAIPISIQSDKDLESVAIFIDKNPRSAIAVFNNPRDGIIDYMLKPRMVITLEDNYYDRPYAITIIGKGRDGKFYQVEDKLNVALSIDE